MRLLVQRVALALVAALIAAAGLLAWLERVPVGPTPGSALGSASSGE